MFFAVHIVNHYWEEEWARRSASSPPSYCVRKISSRSWSLPTRSSFSCEASAQLDFAFIKCYSVSKSFSSRSAALLCASTNSCPFCRSTSLYLSSFSVASLASSSFVCACSLDAPNSASFSSSEVLRRSIVRVYVVICSSNEAWTCYIWELRPSLRDASSSVRLLSLDRISESYNSFVFCSC